MKILSIESSCDETAAAVIEDGRKICSSVIHTQVEEHKLYGGVVPEIASRRHIESICGVTAEALEQAGLTAREVDAVAVTAAPGLIGAVLVGVNFAKGLALSAEKPLIPVHHIRGHVAANYLAHPELEPPFLALIVSGGHSHIVLVRDYCDYPLPTPHAEGEFNFSFSGLKTAVINLAHNAEQKGQPLVPADLAASFCCHVSEILWQKTALAAERCGCDKIVLAGGVSANSWLRQRARQGCAEKGWQLYMPPLSLTGDNAAMIGAQAYYEYLAGHTADESLNGLPTMEITEQFGA